jgi:phosphoglycolate phosphatase
VAEKGFTVKQGIIFDMDGTLWDSADNVAKSWNIAIEKSGKLKRTLTIEDMKSVMGKTMDVIADLLFAELTKAERTQLLELCCETENAYLREHGGILYPQVEETLQVLKQKYNLYIVSNCQKGYIEAFLDYYDFWKYVDDIECYGNNLRSKGDNIRLVAERNGLGQAVYVGDIQGDYDASCKAKVPFIHASYGFGTIDAKVPAIRQFADLKTLDIERIMRIGNAE